MNPLKKLSRLPLLALAVLLCAACAKKQAPVVEADLDAAEVTLRVLNYYDMSSPYSAEDTRRIWDAFTRANPNITIVKEDLFNEPFYQKVDTAAETGELPDVIYAWPSGRSGALHAGGLLKDLAALAEKDELAAAYSPAALDPLAQSAGYLGIIPLSLASSHAFFVNNEVLRDAGLSPARTYGELKAQVPLLREKGYDTVIMGNQDAWVMQSCLFSLVAGRFGGEGWERKILGGEALFTDGDFTDALGFVSTLYADGVLTGALMALDYDRVLGQFADNRAAYFIDRDRRVTGFTTDASTGEALIPVERQRDFGITVFPEIPGTRLGNSSSVDVGPGWGMRADLPAGSAEEWAAWKLIKWLSGREVQAWLVETGRILTPSRTDIDTAGLDVEPLLKAAARLNHEDDAGTAVIGTVFHSDVYTPINDGLQELGAGSRSPDQVARAIQRTFEAWQAIRR
jgi:raffinose/stachyose/melibiose transport system substrate-binding protein